MRIPRQKGVAGTLTVRVVAAHTISASPPAPGHRRISAPLATSCHCPAAPPAPCHHRSSLHKPPPDHRSSSKQGLI
ncbi:hypothetical protein U9M48_001402 [Paspalum notatum var. saurae]|uniref:Uncharacterized protein n=1 Tax=Paspalum notatum var. saurae TaxID=547442 RepID=A0AAQ3SI94_PASNO